MTEVTPAEAGTLPAVRLEVVANGQNVDGEIGGMLCVADSIALEIRVW